ncbi:MAG: hypothetical protein RIR18_1385 [Pseudomonadota bacterium]|jgi:hypothetical protein
MDDALAILDYLPISYRNKEEERYVGFLWESFATNYENEKYEFANLAFHLLYMSYVCFAVWRIRAARKSDFEKAMVGFQNEVENKLFKADSPFQFYEHLKESAIFRFIKLIGCGNKQVGEFSRFVKFRNRIAHPSGTTTFNDRQALDVHIALVLTEIANIQNHMTPVLQELFGAFLCSESNDPEKREYIDDSDQIREALVHDNYLSQKDIEICLGFDINTLAGNANFPAIKTLFDAFVQAYQADTA